MTRSEFANSFQSRFPTTVRFIASKGIRRPEAEEIAQAAWVRGWERRGQLRDDHKIHSWINTIAFNLLRNHARKSGNLQELGEMPDEHQQPSVSIAAKVDAERMLEQCEEENRSLLRLHYMAGYSSAEAGKRHGLTASTTRVRLVRLRNRLRERWLREREQTRPHSSCRSRLA
jgi:RNA polymerase sigma-70 factor (ECF subfamily)